MFRKYKYDIAISVAAEANELRVARLLADIFRKKKIKYYFYVEHPEDAGKPILEILLKVFGKESCIVLVIFSKAYFEKYWADIEHQIADMHRRKVVILRVDDCPLPPTLKKRSYLEWKNDPAEQAAAFEKMLHRGIVIRRILRAVFVVVLLVLLSCFAYILLHKETLPPAAVQVVIPAGVNTERSKAYNIKISKTEVTVAQFSAYCSKYHLAMPPQPRHKRSDYCPVVNITWKQAEAYCRSLHGRLPTEAEWEYAAVSGQNTEYSGSNTASQVAVYGAGNRKASPVASKKENAFGLYDMTGNVAEWCAYDIGNKYYNEGMPVRGGAYNSNIYELKISARRSEQPDIAKPDIGFRVVWDIKN